MNLTSPITTAKELVEFLEEFRTTVELQQFLSLGMISTQKSEAIETVSKLYVELFRTLNCEQAGKSESEGLYVSPDTKLSEPAQKIMSEMQKVITDAGFTSIETIFFRRQKPRMSEHDGSTGTHKHKCSNCGNVWEHSNSCFGIKEFHKCSKYGEQEWWRYFGPDCPTTSTITHADPPEE